MQMTGLIEQGRRPLTGVVLAGAFALGAPAPALAEPGSGQSQFDNQCFDPTTRERRYVREMLARPENPILIAGRMMIGGKDLTNAEVEQRQGAAEAFKDRTAERLGIVAHDATPSIDALNEYLQDPQVPFATYLQVTQNFMSKYGVEIAVPGTDEGLQLGAKALKPEELEFTQVKSTLISILVAFNNMPESYIKLAGAKQINLVTNLHREGYGAYVNDDGTGRMYINAAPYRWAEEPRLILHEVGHLVSEALCPDGRKYYDPGFAKYNGKAANNSKIYDYIDSPDSRSDPNPRHVSYKDYLAVEGIKSSEIAIAEREGDTAEMCRLFNDLRQYGRRVITFSRYHKTVEEDKAEIIADIPNPNAYAIFNNPTEMPRLYKKFERLMTQLARKDMNLVKYLITLSQKPSEDPRTDVCTTIATATQQKMLNGARQSYGTVLDRRPGAFLVK